jgi:hypothetical protein
MNGEKERVRALVQGLETGDAVYFAITLARNVKVAAQSAVLRREGELEELFVLSFPSGQGFSPVFYARNPFRWDEERGVLVDGAGYVYTDIRVRKGEARETVRQYEAIPRPGPETLRIDSCRLESFVTHAPASKVAYGIVHNAEARSMGEQLSLMLSYLEMPHEEGQLLGLTAFYLSLLAKALGIVVVGGGTALPASCSDCEKCTERNDCTVRVGRMVPRGSSRDQGAISGKEMN